MESAIRCPCLVKQLLELLEFFRREISGIDALYDASKVLELGCVRRRGKGDGQDFDGHGSGGGGHRSSCKIALGAAPQAPGHFPFDPSAVATASPNTVAADQPLDGRAAAASSKGHRGRISALYRPRGAVAREIADTGAQQRTLCFHVTTHELIRSSGARDGHQTTAANSRIRIRLSRVPLWHIHSTWRAHVSPLRLIPLQYQRSRLRDVVEPFEALVDEGDDWQPVLQAGPAKLPADVQKRDAVVAAFKVRSYPTHSRRSSHPL